MQTANEITNKWATLVAGSALLLNVASAQPQYNAVDIGSLGGSSSFWPDPVYSDVDRGMELTSTNGFSTIALGINNSGQVVGVSYLSDNVTSHAFLYSGCAMTDLGTLGGGGATGTTNSCATAINDNGQIAGISDISSTTNGPDAFLYSGGTMTDLGGICDEYNESYANGINNSGQVVGQALTDCEDGYGKPFLYIGGTMTQLIVPFWVSSTLQSGCYGINASGQIVGYSAAAIPDPNDYGHIIILGNQAFLYSGGGAIDLGSLCGGPDIPATSYAYGINNNGEVVGVSDTIAVGSHAFLWNGIMTDLGTLGSSPSAAYGINTNGQIVGASYLSDNVTCHAFLYSTNSGTMLDLNNLVMNSIGTYLTTAYGINESGQIIANGADGHAYLLTPASQVTPPPPPPPPRFLSITLTNGMVIFTWSTAPCYTYQVQHCWDLSTPCWKDFGGPITATGYTLSTNDAINHPQRFYRVLAQ
jgi:probable HAF family extracellular repeat protein